MSATQFSTLDLDPALLSNIASLGYKTMTPIQALSLPSILANKDVIAQAKTGSGKTVAFGLGLLQQLDVKNYRIQSLVLCPTRELADQVAGELRKLARSIGNVKILTICGGVPLRAQTNSLEHGAHIIVGTPGRVEDHLNKRNLKLNDVNTLVLDEADRMLAMGFADSLKAIINEIPKKRQTLLFSATYPEQIQNMANKIMVEPIEAKVDASHDEQTIKQYFYQVKDEEQRQVAVRLLLLDYQPQSAIVFCNTKLEAQDIANSLMRHKFSALSLHGDLDQRDRDQTLIQFANKSTSIIVATDVAARGLDIDALDLVINYQLSRDAEMHVHRIGRTGRAGKTGVACTLVGKREEYKLNALESTMQTSEEIDAKGALKPQWNFKTLPSTQILNKKPQQAAMITLQLDAGKKQKTRPGDILGALTGEHGIQGEHVGKISVADNWTYVAVNRQALGQAMQKLNSGKLKGRKVRARRIGR